MRSESFSSDYRLKAGSPDFEKAALTLLVDYLTGTPGRISLESAASRAGMLEDSPTLPVADSTAHGRFLTIDFCLSFA